MVEIHTLPKDGEGGVLIIATPTPTPAPGPGRAAPTFVPDAFRSGGVLPTTNLVTVSAHGRQE